jgi:hypothetical protein
MNVEDGLLKTSNSTKFDLIFVQYKYVMPQIIINKNSNLQPLTEKNKHTLNQLTYYAMNVKSL